MIIGLGMLLIPVLILTFLVLAFATRLAFALILTVIVAIVLSIPASLILHLLARIVAAIFGNEFDAAMRIVLAGKIEQFPLPQANPSNT